MLAEWWEKLNMLWCVCACTFYVWVCRDLNEHMPSMKSLAVDQNENMKNKVFVIRGTVSLCVYLLKMHMLAINHNNSANSVFIFSCCILRHTTVSLYSHTPSSFCSHPESTFGTPDQMLYNYPQFPWNCTCLTESSAKVKQLRLCNTNTHVYRRAGPDVTHPICYGCLRWQVSVGLSQVRHLKALFPKLHSALNFSRSFLESLIRQLPSDITADVFRVLLNGIR